VIGFFALLPDEEFHVRATFRMDEAGYGEKVIKRARQSHLSGEATFAFISKRLKNEATGYVCTGYFGTASINDGPLDSDEGLDWAS